MTAWRMAFRAGKNGEDMWSLCRQFGVAAIEYGYKRLVNAIAAFEYVRRPSRKE